MNYVDVIVDGQSLRWQDGSCTDAYATAKCITRIYTLPVNTEKVKIACDYTYTMQAGYKSNGGGTYAKIPMHAPYMQHWPIIIKEDTTGHDIATLWSAQPVGHVYAHEHIIYDKNGKVIAKKIDFASPDQTTCDQHYFTDCYWDVDSRKPQVVSATWHPTPGVHVLRCTLYPLNTAGWTPSPLPINRVEVHMPYPPGHIAKTGAEATPTVMHSMPGKPVDKGKLTAKLAVNGARMTAHPTVAAAMPKPRLTIRSASAVLTHVCDTGQLVRVNVTVANDGGPLIRNASDLAYLQVRDSGTGSLHGAEVGLPDLAHGQAWTHTLVLGTQKPLGELPGVHKLTVYTGPDNAMPGKLSYVPATPLHILLDVPPGYCQLKRPALSPVKVMRHH